MIYRIETYERSFLTCSAALAANQDVNGAVKLAVYYSSYLYRDWKREAKEETIARLRQELDAIHSQFLERNPDSFLLI